ncbi:MAG: outer membrane protein assembly factor BamD [bacterium]|nr:outer membrane protein assembly factor BamD [bacterium]
MRAESMRNVRNVTTTAIAVIAITIGVVGCSNPLVDSGLLDELADQDKETIFQRGEELFAEEEYEDARRYFSFVYDTFPNDPLGHRAALRMADAFLAKGDTVSVTEARLRYQDFTNRYPNDSNRDYALLMLGNTYVAREPRPDRDLTDVHEAMKAYRQLVVLYPDSPHVEAAQQQIILLRTLLADHEWLVASYYSNNRQWSAVVQRLEYLKENYPEYKDIERVDTLLNEANAEIEKRIALFEELRRKRAQTTED